MNQQPMADQSQFAQSQELMQPPPEELEAAKQPKQPMSLAKKMAIGGGGFLGLMLITLLIMVRLGAFESPEPVVVEITPTPTIPAKVSALEIELDRIKDLVDVADPSTNSHFPPPVDMKVEF